MAISPIDLSAPVQAAQQQRQALAQGAQQYQQSGAFQPIAPPPALAPAPDVDSQQSEMPPPPSVYDITIVTTKKLAQARAMAVPPEEFGIERGARSIKDSNYCFHEVVTKTAAQLVDEGFDANQIAGITDYTGLDQIESIERDTVDEHVSVVAGGVQNDASRLVKITEHYIRLDKEGTGRPALYQVITGGDHGEVLKKNGEPCITRFDQMPFAATTTIPQTHRFFGRSLADVIMPIQREKTALKRGALDNLYLRINPRVEVAEQNAGPNTLDDLLVSRPGGVVRVKTAGGINWQEVPDVSESVYPMIQYLDSNIESRTGISKQTQGLDANALQNQSATAVAQVFSGSQMRMKLVARIMAEGVRDIFSLLHATIRKHGQQSQTVRLRNKWINVDPRSWKKRDDMTINVGLGTGSKAQQFQQTMAIANVQKEMLAGGKTNLVGDTQLYNTAAELTRIMGHRNPNKFFKDPDEKDANGNLVNPPPQPQPDPKVQAIQVKAQVDQQTAAHQAQLDQQKSQADTLHQILKNQADAELTKLKAELDARLKLLEAHLELGAARQDAHHKNENHRVALAGKVADIVGRAHAHDVSMAQQRQSHEMAMQQSQDEGADA